MPRAPTMGNELRRPSMQIDFSPWAASRALAKPGQRAILSKHPRDRASLARGSGSEARA